MPNFVGVLAPFFWSFLPLFLYYLQALDSLVILLMSLAVFSVLSLGYLLVSKSDISSYYKKDKAYYLNGVFGIFGFHFFYFEALKIAPIIPVFLIINLAGIFIILYSAWLNKTQIKPKHLIALLFNFSAIMLVAYGKESDVSNHQNSWLGYLYALMAANCWAFYSAYSRRFKDVSNFSISFLTLVVSICCLVTIALQGNLALLSQITLQQFFICLLIGLGPMGFAFIFWNYGMTKGDVNLLCIISYIIPILGSIWLVLFGIEEFTTNLAIACGLIAVGTAVATFSNKRGLF